VNKDSEEYMPRRTDGRTDGGDYACRHCRGCSKGRQGATAPIQKSGPCVPKCSVKWLHVQCLCGVVVTH